MRDKKIFLFYPTSIVHYRNCALFAQALGKEALIRILLEPTAPWQAAAPALPFERFFFRGDRVPARALEGVGVVVVFSAQPRIAPLSLLEAAIERLIPVVAIEEVYQMMLEQGYVNEYFVPVDCLLAASDYERQKLISFGHPPEMIETSGCVFAPANQAPGEKPRRGECAQSLGLDPKRHYATLSLAYQTPSGETLPIRKQLLSLAAQGLPAEWQLLVKPHPAEQDPDIAGFVRLHAPGAVTIDKYRPIQDVLAVTDLLLNRGNSQVVLDALHLHIPVLALPLGRPTFFDESLPQAVIRKPEDFPAAVSLIGARGFAPYESLLRRFCPIPPDAALQNASRILQRFAGEKTLSSAKKRHFILALYWAWAGYSRHALHFLKENDSLIGESPHVRSAAERLLRMNASRHDIHLLRKNSADCAYQQWLLCGLWIRQLFFARQKPQEEDREFFDGFPPRMNREYFVDESYMLYWLYRDAGDTARAETLYASLLEEYAFLNAVQQLKTIHGSAPCGKDVRLRARFSRRYRLRALVKSLLWEIKRWMHPQ